MAAVTTRRGSGNGKVALDGGESRLQTGRSVRRGELLVGILLAIVGGLIALSVWAQNDDAQSVVYVRNDLAEGAVINAGDLGVTKVDIGRACPPGPATPPDGCLDVVLADSPRGLVGRVATVPLRKGTLLGHGHIAAEGAPQRDEVITAIPVASDRLPTGLGPGKHVRVIDTGDGRAGSEPSVLIQAARVFAVQEPERVSGTIVVSVIVSADDAPKVAGAIAADRVGLVLLTSR